MRFSTRSPSRAQPVPFALDDTASGGPHARLPSVLWSVTSSFPFAASSFLPRLQVRDDVDDALERMAAQLLAEQQAAGQQPQPAQQQAEAGKPAAPVDGSAQPPQQSGGSKPAKRRRLAGVPELCLVKA